MGLPSNFVRKSCCCCALDMWITRKREFSHIPTAQQQQLFLTKFDGRPIPELSVGPLFAAIRPKRTKTVARRTAGAPTILDMQSTSPLPPLRSRQLIEQRLCLLQIGCVEPLGEPAVDGGEQVVGFSRSALVVHSRARPVAARSSSDLIVCDRATPMATAKRASRRSNCRRDRAGMCS